MPKGTVTPREAREVLEELRKMMPKKRFSVAIVVSVDMLPDDIAELLEATPGVVEVVNVEDVTDAD